MRAALTEKQAHYEAVLPDVRAAARACGYGVGVHGSMTRDLELIAVPWVEQAASANDLAHAVQRAACGVSGAWQVEHKPHGRIGYTLHIGRSGYIDLSVVPPVSSCTG